VGAANGFHISWQIGLFQADFQLSRRWDLQFLLYLGFAAICETGQKIYSMRAGFQEKDFLIRKRLVADGMRL
jgi:hypothetical protein